MYSVAAGRGVYEELEARQAGAGAVIAHEVGRRLDREPAPPPSLSEVLDKYCVACHNERLATAGVALDNVEVARLGDDAALWERVARKLGTQEMPPPGRPRPDDGTYRALASQVEALLDAAAAARPRPGRVGVHRLNRTEYGNAVRDLFGLDIDVRDLLPADEADQHGFDNMANVLAVSPLLLERYMAAARRVTLLAVGDRSIDAAVTSYAVSPALAQDDRISDRFPFGSRGGVVVNHYFPLDADYSIRILLKRQLYRYIVGMGERHELDVRIDGTLVKRFSVGGEAPGQPAPESFVGAVAGDPEWEEYLQTADAGLEVVVRVKAGAREIAVSFVRRHWEPEGILQPPQRGFAKSSNELSFGNPGVESVLVGGPYNSPQPPSDSATADGSRVFSCYPTTSAVEEVCATQILSSIARRAYRRPLTDEDLNVLMDFFRAGRANGGFEAGIQRGLERILLSPSFLFRIEGEPVGSIAAAPYRLSDIDLASRLSFFLWSSIPDETLLGLAERGQLHRPEVLEEQVRRMLVDPRSSALVDNFASQWLRLDRLTGAVPDVNEFPYFDENLREAMREETRLFIASQLREDRSVFDLVRAKYTFVNERLARHYGIPGIYGSHFRRVTFDDGKRGGLLGHASILAVTSYPNRTSPVLRGKWLLENLLGAPPPPPPPDVTALDSERSVDGRRLSIREQMALHRQNPACAVCHVRMDPLGFALENFDALGRWRTFDGGEEIDTSGRLPDGTEIDGVAGLRAFLLQRDDELIRTITEKLLAYALGRNVDYRDQPTVRKIAREAAAADARWSAVILGVVTSPPFTTSERSSSRVAQ